MQTATFAAGCFWGVEEVYRGLDGVLSTEVGYSGGDRAEPSYEEVCTGRTGHAECVRVTYDPGRISYDALLDAFWECHDPTQVNRQGPDIGTQYRSVIFWHDEGQRKAAEASKAKRDASDRHLRPIATAIEPAAPWWRAEEYHQQYLAKRGQGACGT